MVFNDSQYVLINNHLLTINHCIHCYQLLVIINYCSQWFHGNNIVNSLDDWWLKNSEYHSTPLTSIVINYQPFQSSTINSHYQQPTTIINHCWPFISGHSPIINGASAHPAIGPRLPWTPEVAQRGNEDDLRAVMAPKVRAMEAGAPQGSLEIIWLTTFGQNHQTPWSTGAGLWHILVW